MEAHTGKFFEVAAKVLLPQEDGMKKKVRQTIVVAASMFGEAEQKACDAISDYSQEYEIEAIQPASYSEIFMSSQDKDDKFFKCKIDIITIDESRGKEKKTRLDFLVNADTTNTAQKNIDEYMNEFTSGYSIAAIIETKIIDCYFK